VPYKKLLIVIAALVVAGVACVAIVRMIPDDVDRAKEPAPGRATSDPPRTVLAGMPSANSPATVATALTECRSQVLTAEQLIAAADTGIGHWQEHVQAQTDFNNGRLTYLGMEETFEQTAKQGVADEKAWKSAAASWKFDPQACRPIIGADGPQRAVMVDCAIRLTAMEQAMPDATAAMKDWIDHLAAEHHADEVDDPEQTWLDTWKAAAPNIDEWRAETEELAEQPPCKA
jgi:hypothetical protein